jgi:hypothetical protein
MKIDKKSLIIVGSIACFTACIGDFFATFFLGEYYPGYSQLHNTMSLLGVTASPVSGIISTWWIILGFLIILFALGLGQSFGYDKKYVKIATWLLIFYGLGEGLGSGLYKADRMNNALTTSAIIHEILGGVGIFAILILPMMMKKIISEETNPGFHKLSLIVFFAGIVLLVLFSVRFFHQGNNVFTLYKGLWQRLFVFDYYLYLMVIAIMMLKKVRAETKLPV